MVEDLIRDWDDKTDCKPYDYAKFWQMHSSMSYSLLSRTGKLVWRESVKNVAEQVGYLLPPENYLKL